MDLKKAEESTNEAHENITNSQKDVQTKQKLFTSTLKSIGLSRKGDDRTLNPHEKTENVRFGASFVHLCNEARENNFEKKEEKLIGSKKTQMKI